MASDAQICSNALRMLGANPIVNLTDDSTEGRLCNGLYPSTRDALVAEHPWNFCIQRVALAQLSTAPAYDYTVQYSLPADSIALIEVFPKEAEYKVEGRNILSYTTGLKAKYKAQITDSSQFPAYFVTALEYYMAARLSFSITKSRSIEEQRYQLYQVHLADAKIRNDHEGTPDILTPQELTAVRESQ